MAAMVCGVGGGVDTLARSVAAAQGGVGALHHAGTAGGGAGAEGVPAAAALGPGEAAKVAGLAWGPRGVAARAASRPMTQEASRLDVKGKGAAAVVPGVRSPAGVTSAPKLLGLALGVAASGAGASVAGVATTGVQLKLARPPSRSCPISRFTSPAGHALAGPPPPRCSAGGGQWPKARLKASSSRAESNLAAASCTVVPGDSCCSSPRRSALAGPPPPPSSGLPAAAPGCSPAVTSAAGFAATPAAAPGCSPAVPSAAAFAATPAPAAAAAAAAPVASVETPGALEAAGLQVGTGLRPEEACVDFWCLACFTGEAIGDSAPAGDLCRFPRFVLAAGERAAGEGAAEAALGCGRPAGTEPGWSRKPCCTAC